MFSFLKKLGPIDDEPFPNFHDRIFTIHRESRFLYLEGFPAKYEETYNSYLNFILEYRHALRNIEFITFFDDDEQRPLYIFATTHLKDFSNLTELCIANSKYLSSEDVDREIPYSIILYDSMINECKNLKTLRLIHISTLKNITPEQWQMIKPQPNVRYLYLDNCSPENNNLLSYIQLKFTNLKKFISGDKFISDDAIIKSANYLLTIPKHYIRYYFGNEYEEPQVTSQLWNLLPNYQMMKSVEIQYEEESFPVSELYSAYLVMKKPRPSLLYINIRYASLIDDTYTLSADNLIIKSGHNIRYLTIKCDMSSTNSPKSMLHLLKLAFKYCLNLESLCLGYLNLQYSMHSLFLDEFSIPSLLHLRLEYCSFQSEWLSALFQKLPNLNTLKFVYCYQLNMFTGERDTNSKNLCVCLPNASLQSIYICDNLYFKGKVFFKIITNSDNKISYISFDLKKCMPNATLQEESRKTFDEK